MAIDAKHLPDDPKVLQQMVLDLTAQLDRESAERNKFETLLRELLDAKRNWKSEQLSPDQLHCSRQLGRLGNPNEKRPRSLRTVMMMTRRA